MCPPAWTRDCTGQADFDQFFRQNARARVRLRGHMAEGPTAEGFNPSCQIMGNWTKAEKKGIICGRVNLSTMTLPLEKPKTPTMGDMLLLLSGVCGVGAAALLARLALDGGMSALGLATWRLTFAASVLLAWQAFTSSRANAPSLPSSPALSALPKRTRGRLALAGACLALHFVAWFASLQSISVARSTLLVTTAPLWAGLLGLAVPALKPRRGFWTGLSVAAAGLFLVTMYGTQRSGATTVAYGGAGPGEALAILGAIAVVPYMLLVQRVQAELAPSAP